MLECREVFSATGLRAVRGSRGLTLKFGNIGHAAVGEVRGARP